MNEQPRPEKIKKDLMFYRFSLYGFLKNLRLFEPFLILIFLDGGLSYLQIGLLYSVRDIATNILEVPTGVFADIYGRRKSMVMSFLSYILSFGIFYLFPNFYAYIGAMILYAFGEAFRSGTHKALILEYLKLNHMSHLKVEYYGHTRGASQLGSALNSLLAAALVFYSGNYRYVFLASTLPYVLDLINLATYPPELDGEIVPKAHRSTKEQARQTLRDFWKMFTDGDMRRALLNSAGFTAAFKSTKDYLQPIVQGFALTLPFFLALDDTRRASVVIGVVYFFIYLLSSEASRKSAKVSRRFTNLAAAINFTYFLGASFLLLAGIATWQQVAIASILIYLGFYVLQNLRRPMMVSYISDRIASRVMASGLSVESEASTLMMAVFAPILGALADRFGVGVALAIFGGLMVLGGLFVRVRPVETGQGEAA